MYRIQFIIEQALGHITHGKNLQKNVQQDDEIEALWGLPSWDVKDGLAARVNNWTVKAGLQSRQILKQSAKEGPLDAIFFHTQVTAMLSQDWMRKIPSIVSLDATPIQYDRMGAFYDHEKGSNMGERVKWHVNQRCYMAAKHLVTWSEWTKRGLIDDYGISAEKITVIPPGVNIADWQRPTDHPLTPTPDQPVKILFVGGNLDRKGGKLLLSAFQTLRMSGYDIELHLVTRDKLDFEPGVQVYNDMQPNSAELKALYHRCDIFCLPTFGDALPMVLSEAGAAGLPVISTRVAAIPEIIRHEKTGLLITSGDRNALIQALRTLLDNPETRINMGLRAIRYQQRTYDAQQNASRLLQLLKTTVQQHRTQRSVA